MKVISVPRRLKWVLATLFLSVPLIALEVILVRRVPWWNLPYRPILYWSLGYFLICIFLSYLMATAKRWAFPLYLGAAGFWGCASMIVTWEMRYPVMGFFTLILLAFLTLEAIWINREMHRSFFDPKMAWYQGLPQPIPDLTCQITVDEKVSQFRVSRFDLDGAFVFTQSAAANLNPRKNTLLKMRFVFRTQQLECQGKPNVVLNSGKAWGVQFMGNSLDVRKEIGDFYEILSSSGYA